MNDKESNKSAYLDKHVISEFAEVLLELNFVIVFEVSLYIV